MQEQSIITHYVCETLPSLGNVQITLHLPNKATQLPKIGLLDGQLVVGEEGAQTIVPLPCAVTKQTWRMDNTTEGCLVLTGKMEEKIVVDEGEDFRKLKEAGPLEIYCAVCRHRLVGPFKKFNRILQLPSESWQELLEFWVCHKERYPSYMPAGEIDGRPNELLVGETHYLLHSSDLDREGLRIVPYGDIGSRPGQWCSVVCRQCDHVTGSAHVTGGLSNDCELSTVSTSIRLLKATTIPSCAVRAPTASAFFANELLSLSRRLTRYRFWICADSDSPENRVLKVWLMNWTTQLATNVAVDVPDVCTLNPGTPMFVKAQYASALKLLYDQGHETDSDFESAGAVETIVFSQLQCRQLLALLTATAQILPCHRRTVRGYSVGYLPTQ